VESQKETGPQAGSLTPAQVRGFRYLEALTEAEAAQVLRKAVPIRLEAGETLFQQASEGHSVYLLSRGRVEIRVDIPGPEDHILAELERGAILGEVALLLDRPRTGSAVALEPCELWEITREAFEADLRSGEGWALKFLLATARVLAHRLDTVNQQVVEFASAARQVAAEQAPASTRVAELDRLRQRLFSDWSF